MLLFDWWKVNSSKSGKYIDGSISKQISNSGSGDKTKDWRVPSSSSELKQKRQQPLAMFTLDIKRFMHFWWYVILIVCHVFYRWLKLNTSDTIRDLGIKDNIETYPFKLKWTQAEELPLAMFYPLNRDLCTFDNMSFWSAATIAFHTIGHHDWSRISCQVKSFSALFTKLLSFFLAIHYFSSRESLSTNTIKNSIVSSHCSRVSATFRLKLASIPQ